MRFVDRDGDGSDGCYRNTAETAAFLNRRSPRCIGGMLEMFNARLYGFWNDLTEALQTGKPQNEIKRTGQPMFDELYRDPARLEEFMLAMEGISVGNFRALAEKFDFSKYKSVCDVGTKGMSPSHVTCATWVPAGGPLDDQKCDSASKSHLSIGQELQHYWRAIATVSRSSGLMR